MRRLTFAALVALMFALMLLWPRELVTYLAMLLVGGIVAFGVDRARG